MSKKIPSYKKGQSLLIKDPEWIAMDETSQSVELDEAERFVVQKLTPITNATRAVVMLLTHERTSKTFVAAWDDEHGVDSWGLQEGRVFNNRRSYFVCYFREEKNA